MNDSKSFLASSYFLRLVSNQGLLLFFERSLRNFNVEGCSMTKDKTSLKKISGVKASLMHSHHLFAYINYQALFDPAPVFTTFNAVHGHLGDAKFFR